MTSVTRHSGPTRDEWTQDDSVQDAPSRRAVRGAVRAACPRYSGHLAVDRLVDICRNAREHFDFFIGSTLQRRYSRSVPILLVDPALTNAMGAFTYSGGVRAMRDPFGTSELAGPGRAAQEAWRWSRGERTAMRLFAALGRLGVEAYRLHVIDLEPMIERMESLVPELRPGDDASAQFFDLLDVVRSTADLLEQRVLGDHTLASVARAALAAPVMHAAASVERAAQTLLNEGGCPLPVSRPAVGTGSPWGSAFAFAPFADLGLDGPTVLIVAQKIVGPRAHWRTRFDDAVARLHIDAEGMAALGVTNPGELADVLALWFVVLHELTHAMIALPTDARTSTDVLWAERMDIYREMPGFEEGLANAVASVALATAIAQGEANLRPKTFPHLAGKRYVDSADRALAVARAAFGGYHADATEAWLATWRAHDCDFGAFAGLVKTFSTNVQAADWNVARAALDRSAITTVR